MRRLTKLEIALIILILLTCAQAVLALIIGLIFLVSPFFAGYVLYNEYKRRRNDVG